MLCGTNRIIYNSFVQKALNKYPSTRCVFLQVLYAKSLEWRRGALGGGGGGLNALGNLLFVLPLIFLCRISVSFWSASFLSWSCFCISTS